MYWRRLIDIRIKFPIIAAAPDAHHSNTIPDIRAPSHCGKNTTIWRPGNRAYAISHRKRMYCAKRSVREISEHQSSCTQVQCDAHGQAYQEEAPQDTPFVRTMRERGWLPGRVAALIQPSAESASQLSTVIDPSTVVAVPRERTCWRHPVPPFLL